MADSEVAAMKSSTEALNNARKQPCSQTDMTLHTPQPTIESAAELLSRTAALSLKLDDFIDNLEKRSTAAFAASAASDHAKEDKPVNSNTSPTKNGPDQDKEPGAETQASNASKPAVDRPLPRMLPQVRECDWEHFVNRYSADENLYCVEVLVANSEIDTEVDAEFEQRRSKTDSDDPSDTRDLDTRPVRKITSDEKWIQRVRIQSTTLLRIFSKVTGYGWKNKPHTFVRPFQYLVYFHEKLEAELRCMEQEKVDKDRLKSSLGTSQGYPHAYQGEDLRISATQSEAAEDTDLKNSAMHQNGIREAPPSEDGSNAATLSSDAVTGLDELRSYLTFARERLLPRSHLFRVQAPSIRQKIRFSELWYLFKPGDFVYIPNKTLCANIEKQFSMWERREVTNYTSWRGQNIWRIESLSSPDAENLPAVQKSRGESIDERLFRLLYQQPGDDTAKKVLLSAYYLGFDGSVYGAVGRKFEIPQFDGEKDILELDIYPLRYHPQSEKLLKEATAQGQRFTATVKKNHWSYEGWTFVTDPIGALYERDDINRLAKSPEHIQGQVMIDFREAFNAVPYYKSEFVDSDQMRGRYSFGSTSTSSCAIQTWSDAARTENVRTVADEIVLQDNCDLQEHDDYISGDPYLKQGTRPAEVRADCVDDLALIPPWVYIYALQHRRFAPVDVCRLRPVEIQNRAFEQLQLPEAHKDMIHAAVHSHLRKQHLERHINIVTEREVKSQDFIIGKGRGLLIMLHGAPGVGKTATAEAIAQQIARPLFPVNCSDLTYYDGHRSVEDNLDQVFRLAHEWNCVLLMDEADVFLSARSSSNGFSNNNLVSIFLRKLEYYNGMLFLTTNRIGKLDPAVASRLHLILHYKRLGASEVLNIFRTNIALLKKTEEQQARFSGQPELFIVESEILQFAAAHCAKYPKMKGAWNGRQIRNAFLVASSLARYEASEPGRLQEGSQPQLGAKHFRQVEEVNAKFWRLRKAIHRMDETARALSFEERDDDFEDEEDLAELSKQSPLSSRDLLANFLQATQTQYSSSTQQQHQHQHQQQQQPLFDQGTHAHLSGFAYAGQTSSPNYNQRQQNWQQPGIGQQPVIGQWTMPNPHSGSQGHIVDPRLVFTNPAASNSATLPDHFSGRGLQTSEEPLRTYHGTDRATSYGSAVRQSQQQVGLEMPYGSATGSSLGTGAIPSRSAIGDGQQGSTPSKER